MTKRAANPKKHNKNPLTLTVLLVRFFFICVGNIPIFAFRFLWKAIKLWDQKSILLTSKLLKKLSRAHFPKVHIQHKVILAFGLLIFLLSTTSSLIFLFISTLPSPEKLNFTGHPLTTEFYDRQGKLLYRLYDERNRSLVKLENVPKSLIQATVAIEDKNFYKHSGVDLSAISRAIYNNFRTGEHQGASTITQQLIKNTLLTPERTYIRKVKEIILSVWTEHIYSKDQILTMYLNETPYGGSTWGVAAASQTYFGKNPQDLSLAESAYLAGLPVSPTEYSPYGTHPELGIDRQHEVLRRMVDEKYITNDDAQKAMTEKLNLLPPTNNIYAPHFVMYVKDYLSQKYGSRAVLEGGLKITTTLDLDLQEKVQKIVKDEVSKIANLNVSNGAAMITDPHTGQILAMIGSVDYHKEGFGAVNVATSPRQPGSSIKPITYAASFREGYSPGNTVIDAPINLNGYKPVNYDGRFHGAISLRTALGSSYNIPAVKILQKIGLNNMIKTAKDLGITTFNDPRGYGPSITLGGGEVTMLDMMSVYGTFSQMGTRHPVTPILRVTDSNGNTLEEYKDSSEQALQPEIAYLITSILIDNQARSPAFGYNSLLIIPKHTVAVKTGTTDSKRDNWTFGYTPNYAVGVWVGNNNNSPMNPALTSGVTGAAPIWNKIMTTILSGQPDVAFQRPAGVVNLLVDGRKDLGVSGIAPKGLVRIAKKDDQIVLYDSFTSSASSSATPYQIGLTN